jgi:glycosyltransferase involved in cell wall biosynthesis
MTERQKIVIIVPKAFPLKGGYENLVYDLSKNLSKQISVHIVCSKLTSEKELISAVKYHPILKNSEIRYIGFLLNLVLNPLILFLFLKRVNPDVVNAHPSFPSGFFALPAKLLNIPIICTSHGMDIQIRRDIDYGTRQNAIADWLVRFTLQHVDIHTLVSESLMPDALDAGSDLEKIKVIHNGVDLDAISSSGGTDIVQRSGISSADVVLLYLGRLTPKKCPIELLRAFSTVITSIPDAKLIFAGKGELERDLKELSRTLDLNRCVIFPGFVSDDEKWDLLKRCDIFVLPSAIEAQPVVLIEAMACEKTAVVTNIASLTEVIRNHENGIIVPVHSINELSEVLVHLCSNQEERIRLGRSAKREVTLRYDIRKIAQDYLDIYQTAILARKSG